MNLRNQIKSFLNDSGMSASELARRAGIPNGTLADWLSGRKPRNLDQVKKLAEYLNMTIDHLVYGNGNGNERVQKNLSIEDLIRDEWVSGVFEVKMRRLSPESDKR